MKKILLLFLCLSAMPLLAQPLGRTLWNQGWIFSKDGESRKLDLPHDWGVEGEFRQEYPSETGKLSWWGKAEYRKTLTVGADELKRRIRLEIDGAMSYGKLFVNGHEAGGWPYGYSSWSVELNPWLQEGDNQIVVTLDNKEESSRWYPGGGIYRNVWISYQAPTSVAHWGTFVKSSLEGDTARVSLEIKLQTDHPQAVKLLTQIFRADVLVASSESGSQVYDGRVVCQEFTIPAPERWSPDSPVLYCARTTVTAQDGTTDTYDTPFGIREALFKADGFYLNGKKTFLKGVCLHHDAGALGTVWNEDAWVRRLEMLRRMGCNAIRCSHNPPAPELLDLCDRMGFLVMDELTDTWTYAKKPHGYAELFDQWIRKDLIAMIHRDRNHPSVILWSIGNECGEQGDSTRWWIPQMLTDLCHQEDPTRLTSAGNDNPWAASQGYANTIDVYGFNYKPHLYQEFVDAHPGQPVLGSETSSCVSTRGYYRFPVENEKGKGWEMNPPFQVSSYDLYAPAWASKPDYEWQYEDVVPRCAGEFVWTGYDYLGEPTPFNMDPSVFTNFHTEEEKEAYRKMVESWGQVISEVPLPSRSSYFGIIDLAGFPKDRYWLYQSRWRPELPVAHILPHWTWPGREGQVTPVHVYTNADEAELFVNGVSQGRKVREGYRFVWDSVVYRPGTVEVVCYRNGQEWARDKVQTALKPSRLKVSVDYAGKDLTYVNVDILDARGTLVPDASPLLTFRVSGPAELVATDAGDPTSHVPFYSPTLPAFHGKASAIVRRKGEGPVTLNVSAPGLGKARIVL